MRTTIDLPDDLLKKAKIAAVERGSTLRDLIAGSLRRELAAPSPPRTTQGSLPALKVAADAPVLRMTPAAMKTAGACLLTFDRGSAGSTA